jgi:23S rRNA (cytosine1962-C5)-methyltransferase
MELSARTAADYELLDCGGEARLERFGAVVLDRPSPVAIWAREHPGRWREAAAVYHRGSAGGGHWEYKRRIEPTWPVRWDEFTFRVKPTGFGHVGIFPEHTAHWDWIRERIGRHPGAPCRVLNLFAYTGALSLLCARAGAEVCHVDAVRDIVEWARSNADRSGLKDAPIRWIVDDVKAFCAREIRRGRSYDGLILDPPSYGKGPKGEKWILEEGLLPLLQQLRQLTSAQPAFVLLTCHTPGFSPPLMKNLLLDWSARHGGAIESGTMVIRSPHCRCVLPAGFFARWSGT